MRDTSCHLKILWCNTRLYHWGQCCLIRGVKGRQRPKTKRLENRPRILVAFHFSNILQIKYKTNRYRCETNSHTSPGTPIRHFRGVLKKNKQWPLPAAWVYLSTAPPRFFWVFSTQTGSILSYHTFGSWTKATIDSLSRCISSPRRRRILVPECWWFNGQTFKVTATWEEKGER